MIHSEVLAPCEEATRGGSASRRGLSQGPIHVYMVRDLYMCTWPEPGTYTSVHGQGPIHVYMARARDLYMCTWPGPEPGTYTCVHGQGLSQGPIHVYMAKASDLYMCTWPVPEPTGIKST